MFVNRKDKRGAANVSPQEFELPEWMTSPLMWRLNLAKSEMSVSHSIRDSMGDSIPSEIGGDNYERLYNGSFKDIQKKKAEANTCEAEPVLHDILYPPCSLTSSSNIVQVTVELNGKTIDAYMVTECDEYGSVTAASFYGTDGIPIVPDYVTPKVPSGIDAREVAESHASGHSSEKIKEALLGLRPDGITQDDLTAFGKEVERISKVIQGASPLHQCDFGDPDCHVPRGWAPTEPKKKGALVEIGANRLSRMAETNSPMLSVWIKSVEQPIQDILKLEEDDAIEIMDCLIMSFLHLCKGCRKQGRRAAFTEYIMQGGNSSLFMLHRPEGYVDLFDAAPLISQELLVKYALMASRGEISAGEKVA